MFDWILDFCLRRNDVRFRRHDERYRSNDGRFCKKKHAELSVLFLFGCGSCLPTLASILFNSFDISSKPRPLCDLVDKLSKEQNNIPRQSSLTVGGGSMAKKPQKLQILALCLLITTYWHHYKKQSQPLIGCEKH